MDTNYDETTIQITNHPYWIFIKTVYQDELFDYHEKNRCINIAVKCLSTLTNIPCFQIYGIIIKELGYL